MAESVPQIRVQFQNIEVISHRLDPLLPTEEKPPVGFSIMLTHRISPEQERLQIELNIQIVNTQTDLSIGELITCCTFATRGLLYDDQRQEATLDERIWDMVTSLSLSTTRGVLHTYFAKTYLNPLILPIIDPTVFRPRPDDMIPA